METNIVETLPWIDYSEVFKKLEERGIAKGIAKGIYKRDTEIAQRAFKRLDSGVDMSETINMLRDLGIADNIIKAAQEAVKGSS